MTIFKESIKYKQVLVFSFSSYSKQLRRLSQHDVCLVRSFALLIGPTGLED
jgi:hypothetical protein